ncbi:hypothetical protein L2E82_16428 [Cichorium intybus]|uniref:Uncharacterized protein n=1 Tax=Cichorium intybus TaxID=13427 RepID=A0ACB9F4V8_CICIN|nr:hypothetical protein L2E82_16428 [Cichorium intybus]
MWRRTSIPPVGIGVEEPSSNVCGSAADGGEECRGNVFFILNGDNSGQSHVLKISYSRFHLDNLTFSVFVQELFCILSDVHVCCMLTAVVYYRLGVDFLSQNE